MLGSPLKPHDAQLLANRHDLGNLSRQGFCAEDSYYSYYSGNGRTWRWNDSDATGASRSTASTNTNTNTTRTPLTRGQVEGKRQGNRGDEEVMYQYQSPTRDIRGEDLFAGIARFQPLRTHLYFGLYLVLLSLFVVYIFVNPWGLPTNPSGEGLGFKSKLDASIHTFFVLLSLGLSKLMRRGHKIQKRQVRFLESISFFFFFFPHVLTSDSLLLHPPPPPHRLVVFLALFLLFSFLSFLFLSLPTLTTTPGLY